MLCVWNPAKISFIIHSNWICIRITSTVWKIACLHIYSWKTTNNNNKSWIKKHLKKTYNKARKKKCLSRGWYIYCHSHCSIISTFSGFWSNVCHEGDIFIVTATVPLYPHSPDFDLSSQLNKQRKINKNWSSGNQSITDQTLEVSKYTDISARGTTSCLFLSIKQVVKMPTSSPRGQTSMSGGSAQAWMWHSRNAPRMVSGAGANKLGTKSNQLDTVTSHQPRTVVMRCHQPIQGWALN